MRKRYNRRLTVLDSEPATRSLPRFVRRLLRMGATAMGIRADFQYVLAAGAIFLNAGLLSADSVKLDVGGPLSGAVTTGAKSVAVRTSTGGLIVFDRAEVKQVTHGHAGAAK